LLIADGNGFAPALLLCRKPQVHQKAHRPAIMPGEVAHENVNDIFIQRQHRYTDHHYSIDYLIASPGRASYVASSLEEAT
jgi:hypothetical protein